MSHQGGGGDNYYIYSNYLHLEAAKERGFRKGILGELTLVRAICDRNNNFLL